MLLSWLFIAQEIESRPAVSYDMGRDDAGTGPGGARNALPIRKIPKITVSVQSSSRLMRLADSGSYVQPVQQLVLEGTRMIIVHGRGAEW